MAKALTIRSIESMKPPASRTEVPDGIVAGLYLVVQPTGKKSWAVRYRLKVKSCKFTLGAHPLFGLVEARAAAREALQLVAKGEDPAARRRLAPSGIDETRLVRVLAAEFLRRHASANRTAAETARVLEKEIYPCWGHRPLEAITRSDVIDLIDKVVDRGSPVMANRVLAAVRKFFNWAVSRDLLAANSAAGVKPPGAETRRDRVLSDNEIRVFWRACDALGWPFGPMFQLLRLTGQRCGCARRQVERCWSGRPDRYARDRTSGRAVEKRMDELGQRSAWSMACHRTIVPTPWLRLRFAERCPRRSGGCLSWLQERKGWPPPD